MLSFPNAHLLALFTFAITPAAFAQAAKAPEQTKAPAESAKREAARRFGHAIKLYEDADYTLALAEFERVYELVPDYRVLYNIGQVSIQLGRYARALRTLKEYASRGGAELPPDRQKSVQSDMEFLTGRVATIAVSVDQPGAEIVVDGVVVATSPLSQPLIVDVGERTVQVRLPGYVTQTFNLTLAGGDHRENGVVLAHEAEAPLPTAATPPPFVGTGPKEPDRPKAHPSRTWIGWTTTGALAAGALVAGALGASAASDLKTLRGTLGASRSELEGAKSRAETRLLVADLLAASAIVSGGVTLYFQLKAPSKVDAKIERPLKVVFTASSINVVFEN